MPAFMLVTRTRVGQYVGDFPDRHACIVALGFPADGVVDRDPLNGEEPRLWLEEAPGDLPRDGNRHDLPLGCGESH
jgi:hypothetical protein